MKNRGTVGSAAKRDGAGGHDHLQARTAVAADGEARSDITDGCIASAHHKWTRGVVDDIEVGFAMQLDLSPSLTERGGNDELARRTKNDTTSVGQANTVP